MLTRYGSTELPCSVPKADGEVNGQFRADRLPAPPPLCGIIRETWRGTQMSKGFNAKWLEMHDEVQSVQITFSDGSMSDEPPVVTLQLRTGEVRTLSGLSLSSQPLPEQEDCALSVTLATAVLTQLLSSWTESVIRITAVRPRMLITFLMSSEMITQTWSHLALDALDGSKRKMPWRRDR